MEQAGTGEKPPSAVPLDFPASAGYDDSRNRVRNRWP